MTNILNLEGWNTFPTSESDADLGRGYSFEAIRAKMLFGMPRKTERFRAPAGTDWQLFSGCYDYRDLGVPLAQLIELLDANH